MRKIGSLMNCTLELKEDFIHENFGLTVNFEYAHSTFSWNEKKDKKTSVSFQENTETVIIYQSVRDRLKESFFLEDLEKKRLKNTENNLWKINEKNSTIDEWINWFQIHQRDLGRKGNLP